jgi:chromosome segregation ATPase
MASGTAALEAEVERLKTARAEDADLAAEMLVRVAEAERLRMAAQTRVSELEAALVEARRAAASAQARFEGMRPTMSTALELIEELERREEMAGSLRTRTIQQVRTVLQGQGRTAPPPAEPRLDDGWGFGPDEKQGGK